VSSVCRYRLRTFNLDVAQNESTIKPKTKAILPVHLYWLAASDDACQSHGATYKGKKVMALLMVGCIFPIGVVNEFME